MSSVPQHIAIIMDGNGRWAKEQGKPRSYGHLKGAENIRNIAIKASEMGVKVLTLYAFSTENWKRPAEEVSYLMNLPKIFFDKYLEEKLKELMANDIRVQMIGRKEGLPEETVSILDRAIEKTAGNQSMTLVFAVNYGGRSEIVDAVNRYVSEYGNTEHQLTEEEFGKYLYTADYPELELLIRTSLDYRISNFLLWQLAYSEFYFTDVHWPDFNRQELVKAIESYEKRDRRYGGVREE